MLFRSLTDEDLLIINPRISFIFNKINGFGLLKYHLLIRYFKKSKKHFDVLFGTYKEIDFGRKGIQYIHFPDLDLKKYNLDLPFFTKIYYKINFIGNLYKNLCYLLSGYKEGNMKKNITLVNSGWTKDRVKKIFDVDSMVIYPPVLDDFIDKKWDEKENGFICVGRVVPVKGIESIINIIQLVRARGFDTHIHFVGPITDTAYYDKIKKIDKEGRYIHFEGMVSRDKLVSMLLDHKYGINGRKDEHFGIAVVEIIKAGCIVFVPNGGGQIEIVDNSSLIFENDEDAVEKIIKVLTDNNFQYSLKEHLSKRANLFSVKRFMEDIKKTIDKSIIQL